MHVKQLCRVMLTVLTLLAVSVSASAPDPLFAGEVLAPTAAYPSAEPPGISAASAILVDMDGTVLYERASDKRMSPASTTKIMTALTVLRGGYDLSEAVPIPADAVGVEGSSVYLYAGEELMLSELLDAMLLESANDAAAAIALHIGGTTEGFAAMMNETAEAIGLHDSHFMNPHGLDHEQHYTTARALAEMTRAALEYPAFRETVSTYKKEIPLKGSEGVRLLVNHNRLLKSLDGCIGVKTGFTKKSGRCLVSACERDGLTLICVTLNAPDDWNDHTALYEWGFSRLTRVVLSEVGEQFTALPVVGADGGDGTVQTVAVRNEEALSVTMPRAHGEIRKTVQLPRFLYAPVTAGERVGSVVYTSDGRELGRLTLYASESAALYQKPSLIETLIHLFKK